MKYNDSTNTNVFDVTINITTHREGVLLYRTLRSIAAQIAYANIRNLDSIQINIGLDKADKTTIGYAEEFISGYKNAHLHKVDFGDLGLSRNYLISKSKGRYIVFFDGDDFYTENFIYDAFMLAEKNKRPSVYSANYIINFNENGVSRTVSQVYSSTDKSFSSSILFWRNGYVSTNFVSREIYEKLQYVTNTIDYGPEDWHWNTRVLAFGYDFIVVPRTIMFYRRKQHGSLLSNLENNRAILRPTELFYPKVFINQKQLTNNDETSYLISKPTTVTKIEDVRRRAYVNPIRKIFSESIIRNLGTKSKVYLFFKYQYHATQSLFSNITLTLRKPLNIRKFYEYQVRLIKVLNNDKEIVLRIPIRRPKHNEINITDIDSVEDRNIKRLIEMNFLSNDVVGMWKKLNQYEPQIRYVKNSVSMTRITRYLLPTNLSDAYMYICKKYYRFNITDLFIVPHLIPGGADMAMVRLAEAFSSKGRKVLVISTGNTESTWRGKIDEIRGAHFLSREDMPNLSNDELEMLLVRFIQHWNLKSVTVMNSMIGYNIIDKYGNAIKDQTNFFVHMYCYDRYTDGQRRYYFPIDKIYPVVKHIITDSNSFSNELSEVNGFSTSKIIALPLPVSIRVKPVVSKKIQRKILFAGRISRQKMITLLFDIADDLADDGIVFDIYGQRDEKYCKEINFNLKIKNSLNVNYHGEYKGFDALPIHDYDIMIMPSLFEGLPNVLLEAIKANLFVVAADVGGVSEVLNDKSNGFLITDNTSKQQYVEKIYEYYSSKVLQDGVRRKKINKIILANRTHQSYKDNVNKIYGL